MLATYARYDSRFAEILKLKPYNDFEIATHISLKNKYVFFQVGKAASSNVKWVLQSLELRSTPWKRPRDVHDKFQSPHLSPFQLDGDTLIDAFFSDSYKRFAFVRNPFTRILSCYLHRIVGAERSGSNKKLKDLTGGRGGGEVSFDEFVEIIYAQDSYDQDEHWRCQSDDLAVEHVHYDFIGKVENYVNDIEAVVSDIYGSKGLRWLQRRPNVDSSPMKTGAVEKLRRYYRDEGTVSRLLRRYEPDFVRFGYPLELQI